VVLVVSNNATNLLLQWRSAADGALLHGISPYVGESYVILQAEVVRAVVVVVVARLGGRSPTGTAVVVTDLLAYFVANASKAWQQTLTLPLGNPNDPPSPRLVVPPSGSYVAVAFAGTPGYAFCLDTVSGDVIWQFETVPNWGVNWASVFALDSALVITTDTFIGKSSAMVALAIGL